MTVTLKCLQRTEHTVDETNPGHLTVNQSEPSYSATKMHHFVLLVLETKVHVLAVLNLPFIR